MDSAFIHQVANELVQNVGTRNIKQIARSCSLDITETHRITDTLGLLSLYFEKPLVLINRQLNKQTKQMVCGYALGHCLERQMLTDLHHCSMQNTKQPEEIPTNPVIWLAIHNAASTSTTMRGHTVAEHLDSAAWYES